MKNRTLKYIYYFFLIYYLYLFFGLQRLPVLRSLLRSKLLHPLLLM